LANFCDRALSSYFSITVIGCLISPLRRATPSALQNHTAKPSVWRHTLAFNGEVVTANVSVDQAGTNHKFAALSSDLSKAEVQKGIGL